MSRARKPSIVELCLVSVVAFFLLYCVGFTFRKVIEPHFKPFIVAMLGLLLLLPLHAMVLAVSEGRKHCPHKAATVLLYVTTIAATLLSILLALNLPFIVDKLELIYKLYTMRFLGTIRWITVAVFIILAYMVPRLTWQAYSLIRRSSQ